MGATGWKGRERQREQWLHEMFPIGYARFGITNPATQEVTAGSTFVNNWGAWFGRAPEVLSNPLYQNVHDSGSAIDKFPTSTFNPITFPQIQCVAVLPTESGNPAYTNLPQGTFNGTSSIHDYTSGATMPDYPTWQAAVEGHYDTLFYEAGQQLVSKGFERCVIKLFHEGCGNWYPWGIGWDSNTGSNGGAYTGNPNGTDTRAIAAGKAKLWLQREVSVLRSVPGQQFLFEWNGGGSNDTYLAYPGDAYVDFIGIDTYFNSSVLDVQDNRLLWPDISGAATFALDGVAEFARTHGKRVGITEWGASIRTNPTTGYTDSNGNAMPGDGKDGGGDPYIVQLFQQWCANNYDVLAYMTHFTADDGPLIKFAAHDYSSAAGTNGDPYTTFGNVNGPFYDQPAIASSSRELRKRFLAGMPTSQTTNPRVLQYSTSPDRSEPANLLGSSLAGNVYIFANPTPPNSASVTSVQFMLDGVDYHTEGSAPYDFNGGSSIAATAYSVSGLTAGLHKVRILNTYSDGSTDIEEDTFNVMTISAITATGATPTAGTADSYSIPLTWLPTANATQYLVEYKRAVDATWITWNTEWFAPNASSVTTHLAGVAAAQHGSSTVRGLIPGTSYNFRVTPGNMAGFGTASSTMTVSTTALTYLMSDIGVSAAYAFGMRKLVSGYAGNAMKVRRSSDSTELDIGFTSSGDLDTTTLLSFAGSGDAFLKTWYDQSGNNRSVTQATTTAQPQLVTGGVLNTQNGKPCLVFDGSNDLLSLGTPLLYAAGHASILSVLTGSGASSAGRLYSESSTTNTNPLYTPVTSSGSTISPATTAFIRNDANTTVLGAGSGGPGVFNATLNQFSCIDSGSVIAQSGNGYSTYRQTQSYTRSGTLTTSVATIGAIQRSSNAFFLAMNLCEVVLFTSALSQAQQQAGEANQRDYFMTPLGSLAP